MAEIDDIREAYYAKGKTISEIARDRKTVRKYILREDFNVKGLVARKKAGQHPKLEPYEATIDGWLESDRRMRRKQRHTARRVYNRLVAMHEDFPCSYRTVATYVRERKKAIYGPTEAALPLVHKAGEAQVDFLRGGLLRKWHSLQGEVPEPVLPLQQRRLRAALQRRKSGVLLRRLAEHLRVFRWRANPPLVRQRLRHGQRHPEKWRQESYG